MQGGAGAEGLTLNRLLDQTEGRGLYLVVILLNLPFVVPIPLPGVSVIFGLVTLFLAVRLAFELPPHLPAFIAGRSFPREKLKPVLRGSVAILKYIERWIRPRRTEWMTWQAVRSAHALVVAWLAFLLALPIPPVPPFTNFLPGLSIVIMAAAMMEEDGVIIFLGYFLSAGTTIYFIFIARMVIEIFVGFAHRYF